MDILVVLILSVLIFIFDRQIRVRHKMILMKKPYNFKYPQGNDCKMVIDGKTLLQLNKEGKFVVIITDDSLSPDYSNGDFVIVSRIIPKKIKRGLCVLVKTAKQHRFAKICTAHRDGTWTIILDEFKFRICKEEITGIIENKIRRG